MISWSFGETYGLNRTGGTAAIEPVCFAEARRNHSESAREELRDALPACRGYSHGPEAAETGYGICPGGYGHPVGPCGPASTVVARQVGTRSGRNCAGRPTGGRRMVHPVSRAGSGH